MALSVGLIGIVLGCFIWGSKNRVESAFIALLTFIWCALMERF